MTLPEKSPVEIEARGLRRRFRHSTRYGPMYFIEVEVQHDLWEALDGVPDAALIGGVLYWHTGDPDGSERPADPSPLDDVPEAYPDDGGPAQPLPLPPKTAPKKGPWSAYWERLFIKGFYTWPELLEELGVNPLSKNLSGKVTEELRKRFSVDSLTFAAPERMDCWMIEKRLPRELVEKSERAIEELGGKEYVHRTHRIIRGQSEKEDKADAA